MITQEKLLNLFKYENGKLYWKNSSRPSRNGKEAGFDNGNGYKKVSVDNKQYYVHRIIYLMHYGEFPVIVDHADRNPSNNKIENLRAADKSKNGMNSCFLKKSKTGFRNVSFNYKTNKFCVYIKVNQKSKFIGSFDNLELADLVAQEARNKYFGEFAAKEAA